MYSTEEPRDHPHPEAVSSAQSPRPSSLPEDSPLYLLLNVPLEPYVGPFCQLVGPALWAGGLACELVGPVF